MLSTDDLNVARVGVSLLPWRAFSFGVPRSRDLLRPKSFAGIFGAAPSVALATLGLAVFSHGAEYASVEARSMLAGALGLFAYGRLVSWLLLRRRARTLPVATAAVGVWIVLVFGVWATLLR